jgi:transposase
MAQKPIAMEQLKQLLQLKGDGVGIWEMGRRLGVSRNTVRKYLSLLRDVKDQHLTPAELAERAYSNDAMAHVVRRRQELIIHFQYAERELGKTGVTRQLLWQEFIRQRPDGYAYSQYCHQSRKISVKSVEKKMSKSLSHIRSGLDEAMLLLLVVGLLS